MRIQFRSLLYFIVLLMFLFSSSVIAGTWELVDIEIPAWKDVSGSAAKPEYTNPSKEFTNLMTQWSNTCVGHAKYLKTQMDFLVLKRSAAKIAADSGWNWRSRIRQIAVDAASKSYYSLANSFITDLENAGSKLGREQLYAAACIEVTTRRPTLIAAMEMMDDMHAVAVEV